MPNVTLLIASLALLGAVSCSVEKHASDGGGNNGWRASPELVERFARERPYLNSYEDKVPEYTLPDPLVMRDGTKVTDAETWRTRRRPEILELFRSHMYGRAPIGRPANMSFRVFDLERKALDGLATRKQVTVNFTGREDGPAMDVLIYLPNAAEQPVPIFLILNFGGNYTVHYDPGIKLPPRAEDKSRGKDWASFPVEKILERGFGLATVYCGDLDPDFNDGFKNGAHGAFDERAEGQRAGDAWGSIGAWAWGLSRAMDYFETDADIDHRRVAVLGHSRLGKTALWAGAQDERFAIVISNNSGRGGAALSRRRYGETVRVMNKTFPHWFCGNFRKYDDREDDLPVDQHMLLALMAPRPVYVASADRDLWWGDPRGEFLSCKHADPVYRLLGVPGLGVERMPGVNQPVHKGAIGYHIRSGGHALTEYDWQRYMDFADWVWKGRGPWLPKPAPDPNMLVAERRKKDEEQERRACEKHGKEVEAQREQAKESGIPEGYYVLIQAEDLAAQGGGKVNVTNKKPGSHGDAILNWDNRGHWLEYDFDVAYDGHYQIVIKYCWGDGGSGVRSLKIDGDYPCEPARKMELPASGGWSSSRDDWKLYRLHWPDFVQERPFLVKLRAGKHKLRLENLHYSGGLNLDYIVVAAPFMEVTRKAVEQ